MQDVIDLLDEIADDLRNAQTEADNVWNPRLQECNSQRSDYENTISDAELARNTA